MLSKANKIALLSTILSLNIIQNTHATGIPVVDGAANAQLGQIYGTAMQSSQTLQNINSNIQETNNKLDKANENWNKLFRELAKGKLGDIYALNIPADKQLTQQQYNDFQTQAQSKCNKIGNPQDTQNEGKELCLKMIEIDKQKIKLYFQSLDDMKKATDSLKSAVQAQQNASTQGEKDAAEHNVQTRFQDLARIQQEYELNIKILDAKKEYMRQRREDLADKVINGEKGSNNPSNNLKGTLQKSAVSIALQAQAKDYKNEARRLRNQNNTQSEQHFNRSSTR